MMSTAPVAVATPAGREQTDRRLGAAILVLLVLAIALCWGAWWILCGARSGNEFIAAPLRSVLGANYGVDPLSTKAAALNIGLVGDVIREQTATAGVDRQATPASVLETSVPAVTQQPGAATPSPTRTPGQTPTSAPSQTPTTQARPTNLPPATDTQPPPPSRAHVPPPPSNTPVPPPRNRPKPASYPTALASGRSGFSSCSNLHGPLLNFGLKLVSRGRPSPSSGPWPGVRGRSGCPAKRVHSPGPMGRRSCRA
jgi:hypothetical protein